MYRPSFDWALIAVLPLLLIIVGIVGGLAWLVLIQGPRGWAMLGLVLLCILLRLNRDKFARTDQSGEPVAMPILPSRAAEERARPGLPNWLHIAAGKSGDSRIEFRNNPAIWRTLNVALIAGVIACFAAAALA